MSKLFIAVVPKGLKDNRDLLQLLSKCKRSLNDKDKEVRWTPPDLWHVTLQFLGEVATERRPQLMQAVEDWHPSVSGLSFKMQGFGAFPSNHQARVLWLGVRASQDFLDLQSSLRSALQAKGIYEPQEEKTAEKRDFVPHLTLARFRNAGSVEDLISLGGRKSFGAYPLEEVIVFESALQGNIIKYVPQLRKAL